MARQAVIQITCSRCGRVEHRPIADKAAVEEAPAVLIAEYKGQMVTFEDLCSPCEGIVESYWKEIVKPMTKHSPAREKGKPRDRNKTREKKPEKSAT